MLLLHGYPETHAAWHAVAPALARRHRIVAELGQEHRLTPAAVWRRWADTVQEATIDGGHLLPEQASAAVVEALLPFLAWTSPPLGRTAEI